MAVGPPWLRRWLVCAALLVCCATADAQTPRLLPPIAVPDDVEVAPASPPVTPAAAQDLEQRLQQLEDAVRWLRQPPGTGGAQDGTQSGDTSQLGPSAAGKTRRWLPIPLETGNEEDRPGGIGSTTGVAGWDNGFYLRSANNNFVLRFTGQIQADMHEFLNDQDRTDISTMLVRRARLGIDALLYDYYEFRLLPDFGQNLGSTTYMPTIQDAYMNVHYLDAFEFVAGKFKQPVSYEQLVQDRFVPTAERSLIDQLVPARDVGFMVHGYNLLGNRLDYQAGVFNGGINGNLDTNGFKDFAWRMVVRPFNDPQLPGFMQYLQFGMSGSTGIEQESMNPTILHTPLNVPFLTFNTGVLADGQRNRWTPEVSYFYGGFGIAAQAYYETQQLSPSAALANKVIVTVPFEGYYAMTSYLLTGETRREYSQMIVPLHPFDPTHPIANPGAWELVARVSRLDIGDEVFAPGAARLADPTKNADRASELTLGYNWYLNAWVRVQFNWEHAWFGSAIPLGGPGGLLRTQDTLLTRLQVIF